MCWNIGVVVPVLPLYPWRKAEEAAEKTKRLNSRGKREKYGLPTQEHWNTEIVSFHRTETQDSAWSLQNRKLDPSRSTTMKPTKSSPNQGGTPLKQSSQEHKAIANRWSGLLPAPKQPHQRKKLNHSRKHITLNSYGLRKWWGGRAVQKVTKQWWRYLQSKCREIDQKGWLG